MSKKKTTWLPRFELLVVGVLFLSFLLWAVSKCNATRQEYQVRQAKEAREEQIADSLDRLSYQNIQIDTQPNVRNAFDPSKFEAVTPLYVTIEGMNMRSGPGVSYKMLDRFKLFDQVYFMNEVSSTIDTIQLGKITAAEPWVKVKSAKGQVGWIYGAGVSYYKKKLEGVE
ncbi:MAG TPA: SH3 domain-containing protein [Saprospiraceae bacterium]|nr:SH3 domain-containing protein [Saprospiraceae bacterium]HMQ84173.1 SH3 domain-containing protein [Saprospiraceae bacterium]